GTCARQRRDRSAGGSYRQLTMSAGTGSNTGPGVFFAGGGTGGHLYPGLAIARALKQLRPDVEPFFIGARRGIERDILPTTEFPHVLLDLHPLYRTKVWNNWRTVKGGIGAWRQLEIGRAH